MSDKTTKAQEVFDRGGVVTEQIGDKIRIQLAIDAQNPLAVFDKLNELEVELVQRAGNDIDKVQLAGKFVDDLRMKTKELLKTQGVDIDAMMSSKS